MKQAHEKMLNILIIRGMQIKITMSYHLTLVRMAIIKNLQITNVSEDVEKREGLYIVGEDVEKMEHSYAVDGNVNWCRLCEKQLEVTQKIRNRTTV